MKKRLHILVVAFALLLSVGATSVGATLGVHALKSSARSTVEPVKNHCKHGRHGHKCKPKHH
jgi:hypothetical protein